METAVARTSDKVFRCQKSDKDVPLSDPHCLNPTAYCKWRTACPIHILEKEAERENKR